MNFVQVTAGLTAAALLVTASPATACIGPAPTIRLSGESDEEYKRRGAAFARAEDDEMRRALQSALFDRATRVSLAQVTSATTVPGVLSDGLSPIRRVEAVPLALFKGTALNGRPIAVQDKTMTTCGPAGGGTATMAKPGDYVLLFEGAKPDGPTGHHGILLEELREPRILARFSEVVQGARRAAPAR
jgi:hypothetical protein